MSKQRGLFEKVPGSGIWWVRYTDAEGRLRREKAGTKSDASDLYRLRKADALRRIKLPTKLRQRIVPFAELCADAEAYTKAHNEGHKNDCYRIAQLKKEFGQRPAESIPISSFRAYFDGQEWEPGTYNRMRTVLFALYRLGIENGKVGGNAAKLLKRKKVSDDRVRWLNQFPPLPTENRLSQAAQNGRVAVASCHRARLSRTRGRGHHRAEYRYAAEGTVCADRLVLH
jgi:hypothetical protein